MEMNSTWYKLKQGLHLRGFVLLGPAERGSRQDEIFQGHFQGIEEWLGMMVLCGKLSRLGEQGW